MKSLSVPALLLASITAFIILADNPNPVTVTKTYYVNSSSTWCQVYASSADQQAVEAFIYPGTGTQIYWRETASYVIYTNSTVSVTNSCDWSGALNTAGQDIFFRGRTVSGLHLKAAGGISNEVKITWYGR